MTFTPTVTLEPIPVEELPPPVAAAPPVQQAPPPAGTFTPQVALEPVPASAPASSPGPAPAAEEAAPAPVADAPPGPVEGAVRGVGEAVGTFVAPIMEQAPEPVRNVLDAVGQPVGGLVDAVTDVTGELGQGDIPGAVGAGLEAAGGPATRVAEEAGTRLAEGKPIAPQNELVENPGSALAILPALVSSALGTKVDDADEWARQNPDLVQAAYEQGGGQGVMDAYVESVSGGSTVPPPQLSNPLDAATSSNPLERGLQVAGAVPDFLGGWAESGKQGSLGPFLKSQAIYAAMDPLSFIPPPLARG